MKKKEFSHKVGDLVHFCKCKSAIGVVVGINEPVATFNGSSSISGYRVRYLPGYFKCNRTLLWCNEETNKKVL